MPLNVPSDNDEIKLEPILDKYQDWFTAILAMIFYPNNALAANINIDEIFKRWLSKAEEYYALEEVALDKIQSLHRDMLAQYQKLVTEVKIKQETPERKEFDTFVSLYSVLSYTLRRLEQDSLLEGNGIDSLTGLRSKSVMINDMEEEMERLSRQGKPFCVAVVHMDNYEQLLEVYGEDKVRDYCLEVSAIIKETLRNFDDAYRIDKKEFVFSLKQTDIIGGLAAMQRIKNGLSKQEVHSPLEGIQDILSVSSCVAEAVSGDKVEDLLNNIRSDIKTADKDESSVSQHMEMSALERYLKSQ